MTRADRRRAQRELERGNQKYGDQLEFVPWTQWPQVHWSLAVRPTKVYRSRKFLVQVFENSDETTRLSINRTELNHRGQWVDRISWDDLQSIKAQCGYGDRWAVECYPADEDVVNVANMRHLWIPKEPLNIGWRRSG